MFRAIKNGFHSTNEYICTEEADIAKLPRVGTSGTQDSLPEENAPCWYGSTAILCTGSVTEVYMLMPNNEWTKM